MTGKESESGRKTYQKALMDLIGCRPVAYWPYLARRVYGVKAAVMLSQLLYWTGDDTVQKRDGWIRKSVEDLEVETGLTTLEQQTARKNLKQVGVLECTLKGVPRIWNYRVNMDRLAEILIDPQTHSMDNPLNGNPIERENHSMMLRDNIGRDSRGMFTRKAGQLNNELKTTDIKTTDKTTSSSSRSKRRGKKQEEEGKKVDSFFGPKLLEKLKEIGVFEDRYPEIQDKKWTDDQLLMLIDQAAAEDRDHKPGSVAALFIYRLRQTSKPPQTTEDRDQADRGRYASQLAAYDDPDDEEE